MTDSSTERPMRERVQVVPIVTLALVWVVLWGSYSLISLVGGLVLAVVLLLAFPLPPLHLGVRIRPWPLVVLVAWFAFDLVAASVRVAYESVAPWVHPHGHLVTIDLRTDDDLFAMITAEMTALVPGTVVVDLDPEHRAMILHIFNADRAQLPVIADRIRAQEGRVLRALARDADQILAARP
ncbi:Na+/H+ antiporter subunit E [Mobilicoccus massiliensis]|uniref:Na+/H+ antiporter subunit E n=1 Tax=Mobilicoccus massiliensis TaxID=1522310 RepID=UPI000693B08D|nr:Na+/H+ antiporter subunit E [Mobilicoccus massiliensis]